MDDSETARRFEVAMLARYDDWWRCAHFRAGRFKPLVAHRRGVGAAKYLIAKPGVSPGFTKLEKAGCLDLTVEALILAPEFASLFTEAELKIASDRLVDARKRLDEQR